MPPYILVKLKKAAPYARAAGRDIRRHGLHGNMHCLPPDAALRLVKSGQAMLLPHQSLHALSAAAGAAA
ncbi:MAG TPA: hypothetical protein PKB14_07755 [Rubrivivax sp.]|nr:hypothetical protein [Rubrivivax sp.]